MCQPWPDDDLHGYRRQVCEHAREKVELALAGTFVEWDAGMYTRALNESVDEQAQRVHVYLCASWIWNGRGAASCTRLCWVEWTGRGRGLENGDLKG